MTTAARLLVLGHAAHDLVYRVAAIPDRPVKVLATSFYECGGGMAGNASVAIARLGAAVSYWGRVADDALGDRIIAELAAENVDVQTVRRVRGCRSPVTSILVSDSGERLICSFTDATLDPDPGWLPLERVREFDAIMVDVRWPHGAAAVLDAARSAGRPALLDADVAADGVVERLMPRATHVLFSEAGLAAWARDVTPGEGLRRAQRETRAIVGATLGRAGFVWLDDDGQEQRLATPEVDVIDTLAAGDVWHGAFSLAIAEQQSVRRAAAFANAAAAIKCQRAGGRLGAPNRTDVEALLARGA